MLNLFAWVTPYPNELLACTDPVGDNDKWLLEVGRKAERVIFCWGSFGAARVRSLVVIDMFPGAEALLINKDGSPHHPLRLSKAVIPVPFKHNITI